MATLLAVLLAMGSVQLSAASSRRGATVRVTLLNGQVIEGELLAVKERSLVVHDSDACQGYIIEIEQAARVRLVKKSKFLQGGFYGILVGLGMATMYNVLWKSKNDSEEILNALLFFVLPPLFGLPGAILGELAGMDEVIVPYRLPAGALELCLQRLDRFARERSGRGERLPMPIIHPVPPQERVAGPAEPEPTPTKTRKPRFRLIWSGAYNEQYGSVYFSSEQGHYLLGTDSCSFVPDSRGVEKNHPINLRRLRLDFDLTRRLSSWIEFISPGMGDMALNAEFRFFSSERQREYRSFAWIENDCTPVAFLVGLSWKPIPQSFSRRDIIDLSLALGPAWVQTDQYSPCSPRDLPISRFTANTWAWKVQAAYDHFYTDRFSLGCFLEYLSLKASFPSTTFKETFTFKLDPPVANYGPIKRQVEFTMPGYRADFSGLSYGVRVGLRF